MEHHIPGILRKLQMQMILPHKVLNELWDILFSSPKRGNIDLKGIQTVV